MFFLEHMSKSYISTRVLTLQIVKPQFLLSACIQKHQNFEKVTKLTFEVLCLMNCFILPLAFFCDSFYSSVLSSFQDVFPACNVKKVVLVVMVPMGVAVSRTKTIRRMPITMIVLNYLPKLLNPVPKFYELRGFSAVWTETLVARFTGFPFGASVQLKKLQFNPLHLRISDSSR